MNEEYRLPAVLLLAFLATTALLISLPAVAAETTGAVVPCDCDAYVVDTDPAGLNVRSGPGTTNSVITTLPTDRPVEVTITGSAGAWMRISDAYIYVVDAPTGDITMTFEGWVYGPLLAVTARPSGPMTVPLYREASTASGVLLGLPMDSEVTLTGCKGTWMKVRYGQVEGWLGPESHCGNPVTTCP
jgi:SH3-like domain-containing protein